MVKLQPPSPSVIPLQSSSLTTYDEANVSRLGLISIQERIPDDYTNWLIEFFREGRPSRLQCVASAEYGGVPHGLDGDIATALTDLYIEQGAPEDGKIRTTAYALLKRAGFSDAGHYYVALKRSLHRLRFAGYSASECWRDAVRERWVTVTFTYLTGLTFSADEAQLHLNRGSELEVRLAEPIVRSIRASYLKPLDYTFLRSLDRPLTRSLFRLLDARRYDPLSLSDPLPVLRVGLIEWARDCKIANLSPDKIRRTLHRAHEELLQRNYLLSVDYEGKGSKQVVTYHFQMLVPTDQVEPPLRIDNVALQRMINHRISRPVAVRLLTQFGEDHIVSRLGRGEQILAGGFQPKSSGAFLVDVIKDTGGKYDDFSGKETATAAERAATQARLARTIALENEQIRQRADISQSTPEERASAALPVLKLVLGKRLSPVEYDLLREYLLLSSTDASKLSRDALAAKVNGSVDQFLESLQKILHNP